MDDRLLRFMDVMASGPWPRWVRRAFILTLPISIPLWLLLFMAGGAVLMLLLGACLIKDFWK